MFPIRFMGQRKLRVVKEGNPRPSQTCETRPHVPTLPCPHIRTRCRPQLLMVAGVTLQNQLLQRRDPCVEKVATQECLFN